MPDYSAPVDIGNRALQHCGVSRIVALTDDSKNASEISFCYDKLRRAELRRNVWRFAIRKTILRPVDDTTLKVVFAAYNVAKTYLQGSVVTLAGVPFRAVQPVPLATPPASGSAYWGAYYGPPVVFPWDTANSYAAGELVYTPANASAEVYLSLASDNADDPAAPPAWDTTVTYSTGDTVTYAAAVYQSTRPLNLGVTPAGTAPWIAVPVAQATQMVGRKWLKLDATLTDFLIAYPADTGPRSQSGTRNVFCLPVGFLREAPQNPTAGVNQWLGAPAGLAETDWELESNLLVSSDATPIMFRFVADIDDVTQMDPMFCEGLAARIGLEVCEILTQSGDKMQGIGSVYKTFMNEARTVNGIETGPTQPPEDAFITCRV